MLLHDFTAEDFGALADWFPDEGALIQWGGAEMRFPLDEAQLRAMLDEGKGERPRRWLFKGVEDGSLVTHAQVALDWRHGVARLGRVGVNPAFRGKGLAVPFLQAIVDRVFETPEFERIELHVYAFNASAIRTYEKLGFRKEGNRRAAVKVGLERWDSLIFGLLRSDIAPKA